MLVFCTHFKALRLLTHCRKKFSGFYNFYVSDNNCLNKKIEFGRCPNCNKAVLKEIKTTYSGSEIVNLKMGKEAEIELEKALFSRLCFISKVSQGTRAKQHWCYGDFKDNKGVQFQIKRNMNGEEVENFGVSEVVLR